MFSIRQTAHGFKREARGAIASTRFGPYAKTVGILALLLDAYSFVVLVSVIVSWLNLAEDNPIVTITRTLTEPVLAPIRRLLPSTGGIDISPMVLLLGIRLLERVLL